jgi:tRNA/tmRNA/rRNA uracil-C5-methylase (TrmA/RlmC/RlmD family)
MTFADRVRQAAEARGLVWPESSDPEPLAAASYPAELDAKSGALAAFWKDAGLPGAPEPIVAAPEPRGYRTTSKRRASVMGRRLALTFPGTRTTGGVAPSRLDRPEHVAVYQALLPLLERPSARALASALNWAIVRGSAKALAVVLNVRVFDAAVVRGGKQVSEAMRDGGLGVASAFLYLDPTGSDYYLEARRPVGVLSQKRLHGPEWLEVRVDGAKLRFPPTVFSQVNEAMLPAMVQAAASLAAPTPQHDLLDLYCGYGLFSLTVGAQAGHVTGVDHDGPAIEAARQNAEHFRKVRARFVPGRINADLVGRLQAPRRPEVVILDPPRQGTEPGVVDAVAARRPQRVVHVCCGTDEIPREVQAWSRAGYRLQRAVPLDLFAGTTSLETLLLLTP